MAHAVNRQWRLKSRPVGRITPDDFELVEAPVPTAGAGEAVARLLYLSLDPTNRIWVTAASVTTAGSIGFIGLVVPHLVRLATGNDQRLLLPASAVAGGALLMLADTLARTLIAPQQLPVGVLTALIGVPVFLFLLSRQGK